MNKVHDFIKKLERNMKRQEAKTTTKACKLLNEALQIVESQSIKDWVQTEHNLPIWLKISALYLGHTHYTTENTAAQSLAVDITLTALG